MSVRDNTGPFPDSGDHWGGPSGLSMDASLARQRLKCYLSQMAALHPEKQHPDMEFVDALIEDRAVVRDHDTAVHDIQMDTWPISAPDTDMEEVKVSLRSLAESMESRFKEVNAKLSVQDTRNFCTEISSRQLVESQREKDRKFRGNSFVQPMAKFHALDLFDLQAEIADIAGHASLVAPPLASAFGASAADGVGQVNFDPDATVTYRDLAPMYDMISRLLWSVDRKVHVQQMAGTSKAGYVATYQHIQRKSDGNAAFSGSKTDREFWAVERLDVEKEILKEKAHEKQLAVFSGNNSKNNSNSRGPNSGPGTSGNSGNQKTGKQKHNAKQRKLYNKRKKAKEAKAKAAAAAASDNSGGSKQ